MSGITKKLLKENWSSRQIQEITCAQWFLWLGGEDEAGERTSDGYVKMGSVGSIKEALILAKARKEAREKELAGLAKGR